MYLFKVKILIKFLPYVFPLRLRWRNLCGPSLERADGSSDILPTFLKHCSPNLVLEDMNECINTPTASFPCNGKPLTEHLVVQVNSPAGGKVIRGPYFLGLA